MTSAAKRTSADKAAKASSGKRGGDTGPVHQHEECFHMHQPPRRRWGWRQRLQFFATFAAVLLTARYILDNYVEPLDVLDALGFRPAFEAWARRNERWLRELYQEAGGHSHGAHADHLYGL